ncbi:hypothetical protein SAMN05660649_01483 [Desulfotomaculum arcticum]|uniref:Uncharacterized protein n=1 Tax=Desulfotruncus arcticus DSM 17038 TaxID=1121424 RepID=A0A1I2RBF6_9FIRM|nr:hypothetical protein SAMN05660649_01483 [Desulfotomaculum arcticum] [Desulfotruncus arcticus DSM 17038]
MTNELFERVREQLEVNKGGEYYGKLRFEELTRGYKYKFYRSIHMMGNRNTTDAGIIYLLKGKYKSLILTKLARPFPNEIKSTSRLIQQEVLCYYTAS